MQLVGRRRRTSLVLLAAGIAVAVAAVAVVAVMAGIVGPGGSGGCRDDKRPGLDPALESRVPSAFDGRPPDQLDSSTTCSAAGLGSLAAHGVTSVRSAGGLWELGPQTGITLAVFRLAGPDRADRIADFYATGAANASKVANLVTTHPSIGGRAAIRLDYSDANFPQAIVVWPGPEPDLVYVVLAAGVPDRIVQDGIRAFGAGS
jgi:hypothetical protein